MPPVGFDPLWLIEEKMKRIPKILLYSSALIMLTSCSVNRGPVGKYSDSEHAGNFITRPYWRLIGMSTFVYGIAVELNNDGSFAYWSSTGCLSYSYKGTWLTAGDTLRLTYYDSTRNRRIQNEYLIVGRRLKPLVIDDYPLTLKKRS